MQDEFFASLALRAQPVPQAHALPARQELSSRLSVVLRVLYLIFNEGYASTFGPQLQRLDLAEDAMRLARILHGALPDDSETTGLLALMLLVHARHPSRSGSGGELIPMADQDRALWDRNAIDEGVGLITAALPRGPVGPYQLQAAIAAVHDEASSAQTTDWPQIVALYGLLLLVDDSPVVALNHAVAVTMVEGAEAGLELLSRLEADPRINTDRRFYAVRGHLLEMSGNLTAARDSYQAAALRATNLQQQRYLHQQAARLRPST